MRIHSRLAIGAALLAWASGPEAARADKFANQFVQFEAPPRWQCVLEGAEWVCQSADEAKKREAIIVLAAKLKGEQDSFDQYLAYLKTPKSYTNLQGKLTTSEVKYAQPTEINGHTWIDSLHLESELPGFYTRYLATIKEDIGILVTYSINKNKYQEYLSEFEAMARTLRVFRKPGGINVKPADSSLFGTDNPSAGSMGEIPQDPPPIAPPVRDPVSRKPDSGEEDLFLYLILGAAAIGFILYRKRAGKG